MKKQITERKRHHIDEQERLLTQNWCSLETRASYWSGSPWRAVGMLFRRDSNL